MVLAGPIAAGKSSVAAALTDRLVASGRAVASVDLDDVARMAHSPAERTWEELWEASHGPFAALVGGWMRAPVDVVVAHGSLYTTDQVGGLKAAAREGDHVTLVLLRVSFETALSRVLDDPERGLSRDPDFLRATHARFATRLAASDVRFDHDIDTEATTLDTIVTTLAEEITRPPG